MEDRKLHMLCHEGIASKVKEYVDSLDDDTLKVKLASKNGVFGYTPVHEAVMSKSASVLRVLLEKARGLGVSVVNVQALNGYTPLHLATSQGDLEVVVTLLRHNADMTIKDDYEKTPLNTAELGRGSRNVVNALKSEGEAIPYAWLTLIISPICFELKSNQQYLTVLCKHNGTLSNFA